MQPIPAVRGTHDLLPDVSGAWAWLHAAHARVAEAHGYRLIDTPILEHTELFERAVGAGTDVVDKEMFTFVDRGGRSVTLRPEGTAGAVRAVLEHSLTQAHRPIRVHYAGPMFRYDRPQKGRQRQFSQVGVECMGERSPYLDAEVVEMAWRFVEALGITGVSLQLNSLGDAADRARYRGALVEHFTPMRDRLCADCRRRLELNPLRLLDCKRDAELMAEAPLIADSLSAESTRYVDTVIAALGATAIPVTRNPRLVRGLDYYAHTAFEIWHVSLEGAQNALGGGGRYDGLAAVLGYPETPGVGYAFGVERLLLVATSLGTIPAVAPVCHAVVCSVAEAQGQAAAAAARLLREAGLLIVTDAGDRRLPRKIAAADRLGAAAVVILGEDEAAQGAATVRDLRRRTEVRTPVDGLVPVVAAVLAANLSEP